MFAKRHIIWLSVCLSMVSSERTTFVNEKAFYCEQQFEDDYPFSMASYDKRENEYLVGSKEILYEIAGTTLDHQVFNRYEKLLDIDLTKFDLKVLQKITDNYLMVCGIFDTAIDKNKGKCFQLLTNIKYPKESPSQFDVPLSSNVFFSYNNNELYIINNAKPVILFTSKVVNLLRNKTLSVEGRVTASFSHGSMTYFVLNQDNLKAQMLRVMTGSSGLKRIEMECESEGMTLTYVEMLSSTDDDALFVIFKEQYDSKTSVMCYFESGQFEDIFQKVPDNNEEVDQVITAQESLVMMQQPTSIIAEIKTKGEYDSNKKATYVIFVAIHAGMIKFKRDLKGGRMIPFTATNFSRPLDIKQLFFDNESDLFALGDNFVCKVQQAMCLYNTCTECIEDPHCGWCISTKKPACKLKDYCKDTKNGEKLDLWKYDKCPIVTIQPNISTFKNFNNQKFTFNTKQVDTDYDAINCALSDRANYSLQQVNAERSDTYDVTQIFKCSPFSSHDIHSVSHAPTKVNVTIVVNWRRWGTNLVSLYQCSYFNSCIDCMTSTFPCNWCVSSHQCQDSTLSCHSIGTERTKINSLSECPVAESGSGGGKAGVRGEVHASRNTIVYTVHTLNFLNHFKDVQCRFKGEGFETISVGAEISFQHVVCNDAFFEYTNSINETRVNVELLTKEGYVIDQNTPLYFTLYKCEEMASKCGACSLLPPEYQCVWCPKEKSGTCMSKGNCEIATHCNNPHIYKISPIGGPVKGNTLLTIHGDGLGKKAEDVEVFVANKKCPLVPQHYSESLKVACRTADWTSMQSVSVLVRTYKQYNVTSPQQYLYAETTVKKLLTKKGIEAGGRVVVLTGENLHLGSPPKVLFAEQPAVFISRTDKEMKVKAPAGKQSVPVKVDGKGRGQFTYVGNPKNLSFQPNISFQSGGRKVIVKGRNLGEVSNAILFINANNTNSSSPPCVYTNNSFECITPKVDFTESPLDRDYNIYQVFFHLDNYVYYYESRKDCMKVYPDPTFFPIKRLSLTPQDSIHFQMNGKSKCVREMEGDIEVLMGGVKCEEAVTCNPDNMSFTLLLENCPHETKLVDVKVRIKRFEAKVGEVKFIKKSKALIVGVVVGVLLCLFLLLLIFLFIYCKRKYANNKPQSTPANRPPDLSAVNQTSIAKENPYNIAPGSGGQSPLGQDYLNPTAFINDEAYLNALLDRLDNNSIRQAAKQVYIARDRLELGNQLGKGHFGKVHAATLRDLDLKNPSLVAVKTIDDPDLDQKMVEGFLKEGVIMKNFEHPHVLNLIGLCVGYQKEPMVVLPFMANGDLRSYVKDKKRSFTARQLLKLAQQVSEGMSYLASLNFIHRDLAARNCMIDDKSQVKVADFGLSHELHDSEYYSSKNRKAKLPIKWMALESLENYVFTTKSDVWSFGVLMWELMTRGVTPYPDVDVFETRNYLNTGRRLYKPKFCPDNVFNIMTDCWQELPERRPTFTDLVNRIEVLLNPPKKQTSTSPTSSPNTTYVNIKHPVDYQDYLKPNVDSEAVVVEGGSRSGRSGDGVGGSGDGIGGSGSGGDGEESNGSSDEGNNISKGLLSVRRKKGGDKVV